LEKNLSPEKQCLQVIRQKIKFFLPDKWDQMKSVRQRFFSHCQTLDPRLAPSAHCLSKLRDDLLGLVSLPAHFKSSRLKASPGVALAENSLITRIAVE
jgi:hypothetical protein